MPLNEKQTREALIDARAWLRTYAMHTDVLDQMLQALAANVPFNQGENAEVFRAISAIQTYSGSIVRPDIDSAIEGVDRALSTHNAPAVKPVT